MRASDSAGNPPFLSQANALGQGFNVYGALDPSSLIAPLFDFTKAPTTTFTFLGRDYLIPAIVNGIEDTTTYYSGGTFETRDEFQNSIAAHANVAGSYGAFGGELDLAFSREVQTSSEFVLSYRSMFARLAYLQLRPDPKYLSSEFSERLRELPNSFSPDVLHVFEDFFNSFGVYFTSKVALGANLDFWVATEKSESLTDTQITAYLSAEYEGLTTSGSISTDITISAGWKQYAATSDVSIEALGADPALAARVAGLPPWNPSAASVDAYSAWVNSIKTDPALIDFELTGIWEIAGSYRKVLQEAWDAYGTVMRPVLVATTSTTLYPPTPATPPAVTLGKLIAPSTPPTGNAGYQVIVLGGTDITAPGAVLFDRYYSLNSQQWDQEYEAMYQEMAADLGSGALTANGNVFVVAGFNMNWNAVPTPDFVTVLRNAGAGDQLTYWLTHNDRGSALGTPANVVLAGIFGQGIGSAVEYINMAPWGAPTPALVQVLFYRRTDGSGYAIGQGDIR